MCRISEHARLLFFLLFFLVAASAARDLRPLPIIGDQSSVDDPGTSDQTESASAASGRDISMSMDSLFRDTFQEERVNFIVMVTGRDVNIRSGPGRQYPVIDKAGRGDEFLARNMDNSWTRIALPDMVGWISDRFLRVESSGTDGKLEGTVTGTGVNIRSGPGTSHSRISRVSRGNRLVVLDKVPGWYRIKIPIRREGYIFNELVVDKEKAMQLISTDGVNLREKPGPYYRLLGSLNRGARVYRLDEKEDWTRILDERQRVGWVASRFLETPPAEMFKGDARMAQIRDLEESGDLAGLMEACEQYLDATPAGRHTPNVRFKLARARASIGNYASALREINLLFQDRIFFEKQDEAEALKQDILSGPANQVNIHNLEMLSTALSVVPDMDTPELMIASFTARWGHVKRFQYRDGKYQGAGRSLDIMDQEFVDIVYHSAGTHVLATRDFLALLTMNADSDGLHMQKLSLPFVFRQIRSVSVIESDNRPGQATASTERDIVSAGQNMASLIVVYEDNQGYYRMTALEFDRHMSVSAISAVKLDFNAGRVAAGVIEGNASVLVEQVSGQRHDGILHRYRVTSEGFQPVGTIAMQLRAERIIDMLLVDVAGTGNGLLYTLVQSGAVRELRAFNLAGDTGVFIRGIPLSAVSLSTAGPDSLLFAVADRGELYEFKRF